MQEFITDDEIASRLREARDEMTMISQRATVVAARLDETAQQLGPEAQPEPEPSVPQPLVAHAPRRAAHKQDRLPI